MKIVVNNKSIDRNKRVYVCNVCGNAFNWSKNSSWYGSIKMQEYDPNSVAYFCSRKCCNNWDGTMPNGKKI